MAPATIFRPANRLASIAGSLSDPTAKVLERRATQCVATLADDICAHVAEQVRLIAPYAKASKESLRAECEMLKRAALEISEVAGAAGLAAVGQAARGIRTMIDALAVQGLWHHEALKLHIDALIMFDANPTLPQGEVEKVLARLKALRDGIGVLD